MLCFKRNVFLRAALLIFIVIGLTSCVEVKQQINLYKDGSGDARLEVAVQEMWAPQVVPELKSDMPKEWNIIEEKAKEGKQVIIIGRKFKDISELNDGETEYAFSSERKGFMKKSYNIEIKQLKSSDMPFPYEVTIKTPGSIEETNGQKISSGEVKWSLQGLRRGTELTVKSSAFAMPDFAALKDSFNKVFNSVFYREAIVFLRDDNLWVMDSDGKNERQLTKEGVGSWSISRDGKIVFDRFVLFRGKDMTDLNIYYIDSVKDDAIKRLTGDNKSITPLISPDGKKVVFQKFRWGGETYIGSGEGIWTVDLRSGKQKELLGVVPIPDEIKRKRNELSARFREGEMDKKRWLRDKNLIWSYDGKQLLFSRFYKQGGYVTYIVALEDRQHPVAPPDEFNPGALDLYGSKMLYFDNPSFSFYIYDLNTKKPYLLAKNIFIMEGKFSPDGKNIAFHVLHGEHASLSDLWLIDSDGKDKRRVTQESIPFIEGFSLNGDANKIVFQRFYPDSGKNEGWTINIDGSNLIKLADNASSPQFTSIPRITFVSADVARIVILVAIGLTSILFLFGMALITRRAVKVVIPKIPKLPQKQSKPKGIFCPQCGKENSVNANFCTGCGQKLK